MKTGFFVQGRAKDKVVTAAGETIGAEQYIRGDLQGKVMEVKTTPVEDGDGIEYYAIRVQPQPGRNVMVKALIDDPFWATAKDFKKGQLVRVAGPLCHNAKGYRHLVGAEILTPVELASPATATIQ